jgi:hypothetical protein
MIAVDGAVHPVAVHIAEVDARPGVPRRPSRERAYAISSFRTGANVNAVTNARVNPNTNNRELF